MGKRYFRKLYKKKKGSLELSLNLIIMLIIGMVILGLVIGFVRGLLKKGTSGLTKSLTEQEQQDLQNYISSCNSNFCVNPSSINLNVGGNNYADFFIIARNPTNDGYSLGSGYLLGSKATGSNNILTIKTAGGSDASFNVYCNGLYLNSGDKGGEICRVSSDTNVQSGQMYSLEITYTPQGSTTSYKKFITIIAK